MIVTNQMNSQLREVMRQSAVIQHNNVINNIAQTNDAEGTHVDDIFQDNTGAFSQVLTLNNGCDATTFSRWMEITL